MTTSVQRQVLINARALIVDPTHWTTGMLARTADGDPVDWHDHSAARWCAMGAIYRAAYDLIGDLKESIPVANEAAKRVCPARWFRGGLTAVNDTRGHAVVLTAFDKALRVA